MKPQKQLLRHRPADGVYGDCHRTAIAIVLDMDAADVPHFMEAEAWERGGAGKANAAVEAWLNARGITAISVFFPGDLSLDRVLNTVLWCNPDNKPVFILGGTSRNGINHSVVCCDGKIVCDPSLDESGIIGPCDHGFYEVTFFGTLQATDSPARRRHEAAQ